MSHEIFQYLLTFLLKVKSEEIDSMLSDFFGITTYILSILTVLVECCDFGPLLQACCKLQFLGALPFLSQISFPDGQWKWGFKVAFMKKSLCAFSLKVKWILTFTQCKDTNPLSYSIVALWHFSSICIVHLQIILSVIILIKQLDFQQFKYIILQDFPCGHHFFNV